jgi:hypothetical protein
VPAKIAKAIKKATLFLAQKPKLARFIASQSDALRLKEVQHR